MDLRLDGKVALITGASRGIGAAMAAEFVAAGAKVMISSRKEAALVETALAIESRFGDSVGDAQVAVFEANAGNPEAAEACVSATIERFGRLDILVNNAGITRDTLAMRMKDDDWDAVLDTNLKAVFRMSRAVMRPMMKQRYGRIISITSVVGAAGNPGQANYAAAKAGVAGMTRALARELGSRNITVNCVAPGFIATDMTAALPEAQHQALMAQIPLGKLGLPEDIAHAVSYLASPLAAYVTGQELHVNGGMHMT